MTISLLISIILISVVALIEIKERNKEITKLKKDWEFCKNLLDEARGLLTKEQKEGLIKDKIKKDSL
ncbi:MAG: hypothetical protein Q8Q95_00165 [bacterium]|nr:hypothetical protein [bacterium]